MFKFYPKTSDTKTLSSISIAIVVVQNGVGLLKGYHHFERQHCYQV